MTGRDAFLERVRKAVAAGNQAGHAPALAPRGVVGYQGAADRAGSFREHLTAAGGVFHAVPDTVAASALILSLLQAWGARRVLLGRAAALEPLDLAAQLPSHGITVHFADEADRETTFAADAGISGVDALIAETGSLVMETSPQHPRGLSLLPPFHIAVAAKEQLLPDLFDLFEARLHAGKLPACVTLITGPSKTGDIELRLVTGVHGPGEVHVVLID